MQRNRYGSHCDLTNIENVAAHPNMYRTGIPAAVQQMIDTSEARSSSTLNLNLSGGKYVMAMESSSNL